MLCSSLLLGLHLATYHFPHPDAVLESDTPGIYATCDGWTLGALRNSVEAPLLYVTNTWQLPVIPIDLSLGVGRGKYPTLIRHWIRPAGVSPGTMVAGPGAEVYEMEWKWIPVAALSYKTGPFRFSYLPARGKDVAAIHLSAEFKVDF